MSAITKINGVEATPLAFGPERQYGGFKGKRYFDPKTQKRIKTTKSKKAQVQDAFEPDPNDKDYRNQVYTSYMVFVGSLKGFKGYAPVDKVKWVTEDYTVSNRVVFRKNPTGGKRVKVIEPLEKPVTKTRVVAECYAILANGQKEDMRLGFAPMRGKMYRIREKEEE